MLAEERGNLPRVDRLPWHFAHRVMTAGKPDDIERQMVTLRLNNDVVGEINRKSQIITR